MKTEKQSPLQARRHFLKGAAGMIGLGAAAPMILPSSVLGDKKRSAASERVTVGVVGLGARGFVNLEGMMKLPDTQIVALCDVDTFHYRENTGRKGRAYGLEPAKMTVEKYYAQNGSASKSCDTYSDYRELCARDDIDAIVVATPDHWHALCTLEALRSGKDVYCEKPVTHLFAEGQAVYREVAKQKATFQTGSQQRSSKEFHQAVELVMNGTLGKIKRVEVGLPTGYPEAKGSTKIEQPPAHLDYAMWCGPSPVLPYMRARHHRWWRGNLAYGGGNIMDFIGHHNDINHWALGLDKSGPLSVEAVNWKFPETKVYNTPVDYEIRCEYPGDINVSIASFHKSGIKWFGENGSWIYVTRGKLEASELEWTAKNYSSGAKKAYLSPGHHRNFVDGIKSRKECIAPAETAHRSVTPGHLGYVSQTVGRKLNWDTDKELISGDNEAQQLLTEVSYSGDWKLA